MPIKDLLFSIEWESEEEKNLWIGNTKKSNFGIYQTAFRYFVCICCRFSEGAFCLFYAGKNYFFVSILY